MDYEILDNGIKLYKILNKNVSTIGIGIGVNVGSIYEDKEKRGISHLLEHMSFKTNYKYKAEEIDKGLELNGGISNAYTTRDLTGFITEVIPEGFEKVLDILYTVIDNKKYLKEEFENEKKVVISEIGRSEANPSSRLFILSSKSVYGDSDYGDPIAGYQETVKNIELEDLEEFKEKYYVSNNMFIILEGNFNDKIVEMVKNKFKNIKEEKVKLKKPIKGIGSDIFEKRETEGMIFYSYNINENIDSYIKIESISELLSGGVSSIIFQIFRNKYGIGYSHILDVMSLYEDELIYSFAITGFEKDREKYLDNAINDLLNYKIDKEYIEGRIRHKKVIYDTKIKNNIFARLEEDLYLIKHFGKNIDEIEDEIIKEMYNYEENKYLLEKLFDKGKKVIIYPNE